MTETVLVTVYYPRMGPAHDLQASALFCSQTLGFHNSKTVSCSHIVVFAKCLTPSKCAGIGSAQTGLQFFTLYLTLVIGVPPPVEILLAGLKKEKCCGQPK